MFDLVTQQCNDHQQTFEDLVIAKGTYEKGAKDEIEVFIYHYLMFPGMAFWGGPIWSRFWPRCFDSIFTQEDFEPHSSNSSDDNIGIYVSAAIFSKNDPREGMSFEDFKSWCTILPYVKKFLGSLLMPPDSRARFCFMPLRSFSCFVLL